MAKKDSAKKEVATHTQSLTTTPAPSSQAIIVADALPMRLQRFDLARHTVIAPDGKRFVVASFDDTKLARGYVTAVYPQQNGYLTLVRLTITQRSSTTPQEALQVHNTMIQSVQQGEFSQVNGKG